MEKASKKVLQLTASKLMFDMTDEEYDCLVKEFEVLIKQMNIIGEIKGVDNAEPMTFPFDATNSCLREDISSASIKKEEALKNAKDVKDGQIRLPRVLK